MGAGFLLRGLRNTTDFEYENSISQVNRHLVEGLETIFLITSPHLAPISSTIVRDLHKYGTKIDEFIPYNIHEQNRLSAISFRQSTLISFIQLFKNQEK
ncbi:hypothetical protein FGO68_gene15108 [Halteria grandinella]|uniref:Uncharacterized protein n=1 Tax=Halteria grandinella TaxID=5974 RepID=A0A8J8SUT6_HALGN|nr:hypothetical protein FGO68_gene15108 [Halteria grandinella]